MTESIAFEELNPLMQAEIISWYDWQWVRVRKFIAGTGKTPPTRDQFILACLEKATELYAPQCAYIGACCLPDPAILDELKPSDANDAVRRLYTAYLEPESARWHMSKLDQMTRDGFNALKLCAVPYHCILTKYFHPAPVFHRFAHYRKASNRVYSFLKSLGKPDQELRVEFLKDVCNIKVDPVGEDGRQTVSCSPYEQHLMLDASEDGKTTTVFLDLYAGAGNCILLVREKDSMKEAGLYIVSTRRELAGESYTQTDDELANPDGEQYAEYFDLLVNAWVAENTGMAVVGEEPKSEQARVRNIIDSVYKPTNPLVRYEYVKVTDKAWQMHTEAQRAFRERSGDSTYTKQFWWRRPHFAVRGKNKVMIKGHWCHRRCGEVVEVNEPQVIEVLT